MEHKIKIQLVGGFYIKDLVPYFPSKIYVQNIRRAISPFAAVGPTDEKLISEWENKLRDINNWEAKPEPWLYDQQRNALFDLKKNFYQFLSRDPKNFSDNITFSQMGHEVLEKNEAQYIIVDNTDIDLELINYNGVLYNSWPTTPLLKWIGQQQEYVKFIPSKTPNFNWKFYYDKYIETILEQYDSEHIILIKTQCSEYFKQENDLKRFPTFSQTTFEFVEKIDNYFAAKTRCRVINDLIGKIPCKNVTCVLPYGIELGKWQSTVTTRIVNIIEGNSDLTVGRFNNERQHYYSLAKSIDGKLCERKHNEYNNFLNSIEQKRIPNFRKFNAESAEISCPKDILILKEFISDNKSLGEYLQACDEAVLDKEIVRKYTENFLCNLNDILNLYIHRESFDKETLKMCALNICKQKDNPLIKNAEWLYRCNVECLMQYEYIDSSYLPSDMSDKIYIQINDGFWLVIDSENEEPFYLAPCLTKLNLDHKQIINNGYYCGIDYADALTYNYDYYVEKARKGDGNKPTYLRFDSEQEFIESLYFINYSDLLKNERFVFAIGDNKYIVSENYMPVVDLTELMNPYIVTVGVFSGLGDQMCYYVLGQVIETFEHRTVIYDDTRPMHFNGFEVYKFAKKPMNLLSDILSNRLNQTDIFRKLYKKINEKYIYVTHEYNRYHDNADGSPCIITGNNYSIYPLQYLYYNALIRIQSLISCYDFSLRDFIEFPPFVEPKHIELSKEILAYDSIIIHVRRGDYAMWGWDTDTDFYKEAIATIWTVDDLRNKKVFVFSDDISWCKENQSGLGLDNLGNTKIVFVEGNKGEDSFRDIQLMSLGKVMICGASYFAQIAILYGQRWEIIASAGAGKYRGKYDLGSYSKNYSTNYSRHQPKQ